MLFSDKHDLRTQIFLVVKKIMNSSEQAQIFATKIDLMDILSIRTKVIVDTIGTLGRIDMNKKHGVTKVSLKFNYNQS